MERSTNHVEHKLVGMDVNSKANIRPAQLPVDFMLTERGLIEHIMRRSLYAIFQRFAVMSVRNPDGLIADLKALRKDETKQALLDYTKMWSTHLSIEMDTEGLFDQDIELMRNICKGK